MRRVEGVGGAGSRLHLLMLAVGERAAQLNPGKFAIIFHKRIPLAPSDERLASIQTQACKLLGVSDHDFTTLLQQTEALKCIDEFLNGELVP